MAKLKLKNKSKRRKLGKGAFKTGQSASKLQKSLREGGGGTADPEMIMIFDGDQIMVTFAGGVKDWTEFYQHYLQDKRKNVICSGDGCPYCDVGINRSKRNIIPVYVHTQYKAGNKGYKAQRLNNVGYRFMILNKETSEALLKKHKLRGRKFDRKYIIERTGSGLDTKFDIERDDERPKKSVVKGWDLVTTIEKLEAMFESESSDFVKPKRQSDEDYDDYGDDDDDEPIRKKKKRRRKSRRR